MRKIAFDSSIGSPLIDEIRRGFTSISMKKVAHGRPIAITLWRADGSGLTVKCVMHDIAERLEVGSLQFARAATMESGESRYALDPDFGSGIRAWKLVISADNAHIESGILMQSPGGKEAVVVCGANPFTLTVKASGIPESFEPEYPITQYSREPLA